jgi:hypothetical protein
VKQSAEQHSEWQPERACHLSAPAHAAETPVAKVFAVIGQQAIVILAETRAGTPHYLLGRIRWIEVIDDPHLMTIGKSKQRYLLDGSALPGSRKTRVMYDPTVADIYAMVAVPSTRTLQVCAETGFPLEPQWPPRPWIRVFGHWLPVIHGRVRSARCRFRTGCSGRSVSRLRGSQTVRKHAKESDSDHHGRNECEQSKQNHERLLESGMMSVVINLLGEHGRHISLGKHDISGETAPSTQRRFARNATSRSRRFHPQFAPSVPKSKRNAI